MTTTANIQFYDNIGNKAGTASARIKGVIELLELTPNAIGETDIFGQVITAEMYEDAVNLCKSRAADLLEAVAAALRK